MTFQATGCPGHHPPEKLIGRWKGQEKDLVLGHMLELCNLAREENARAEVKEQCCENNPCKYITCVRQRTFIQGPSSTSNTSTSTLDQLHCNVTAITTTPSFLSN